MHTPYLAPTPEAPAAAVTPETVPDGVDATAEFAQRINNPKNFIVKQGVPVFKSHQRTDPNTQKLISVDLPKLYRIAANMQQMDRKGGVPVRMTLGHTEPGKNETQQPPIAGYYRNPRVQKFGPGGEPAIVVDEYLDPQFANVRKNYPYRSSEYYDDTEQITGVALLTRDPFLDLGVVAYQKGDDSNLTYERRDAASFIAHTTEVPGSNVPNPTTGRTPVLYRLNLGEVPMFPQQGAPQPVPNQFTQAIPQQPAQPVQYAAQVQQPEPQPVWGQAVPGSNQPTNYAYQPTAYWDGNQSSGGNPPRPVPHQHTNTGAIYGRSANYGDIGEAVGAGLGAAGGRYFGGPLGGMAGSAVGGFIGNRVTGGSSNNSRANYGNEMLNGGVAGSALTGALGNRITDPMMAKANGQQRYAADEDGPPNAGPPGSEPGQGGDPLDQVCDLLMQAAQTLAALKGDAGGGMGGPGGPPPMGAGGPPMMASRTGGNARYGRVPSRPRLARYETPRTPTQYAGATTISGMPVGVQMKLDQLNYENRQLKDGMQVLFYERDQADTHACIETIRSLQYQGFQVGEFEVGELKKKTPEERAQYIQHIATHYQQIGTQPLPQQLGDPTPAPMEQVRPMDKEIMNAALRATKDSNDPNALIAAMTHYQRNGVPTGQRFTPQTVQPSPGFDPNPFEGQPQPQPTMQFANPYTMD